MAQKSLQVTDTTILTAKLRQVWPVATLSYAIIRPRVIIAGVLYGIWPSRLWETRLLGLCILGLMLGLENPRNRRAAREQFVPLDSILAAASEPDYS